MGDEKNQDELGVVEAGLDETHRMPDGLGLAQSDTIIEPTTFPDGSQQNDREFTEAPTLASASEAGPAAATSQSRLQVGGSIGRLELGEALGTGAFGLVVAAFDPELKRKLAVKILKPEVFESAGGHDAQQRLLREARAMAKISHPNVVTVHDIGMLDGQVYVAMEFVEGTNLRGWLDQHERSWQEIIKTFEGAGRGLAAAHREGLVHRDFKPDNVLVGKKGEIRVADFGLVSIGKQKDEDGVHSSTFPTARVASEEINLTQVGALMGTALYMAPEQHLGKEATQASDQFAFCVSLYWALYGKQPFDGSSYKQLRSNVLKGKLNPGTFSSGRSSSGRSSSSRSSSGRSSSGRSSSGASPSGASPSVASPSGASSSGASSSGASSSGVTTSNVPKYLYSVLRTGLATDPADRHPSMDALLELLLDDPSNNRRGRGRYFYVAVPVFALALGGVFFGLQSEDKKNCDTKALPDEVWGTPAQETLASVFRAANRDDAFTVFQQTMERHSTDWASLQNQVCVEKQFHGGQATDNLGHRSVCLEQRLSYLSQVITELTTTADGAVLDSAVKAVVNLTSMSACVQRRMIADLLPLPESVEMQQAIAVFNDHVNSATALFDLGDFAEAAAVLEQTLADTTVTYSPALARATQLLGKAMSDMGKFAEAVTYLEQSIEYGTHAGADTLVAWSWLALQHLEGNERENFARSHEMARMAKLAMLRGHANENQMAELDRARASILLREGKVKEAISLLENILPIFMAAGTDTDLVVLLSTLGNAKSADGRYKEAIAHFRLGLAHIESLLGTSHPDNIYMLNNLSVALKHDGDIEGSRKALMRSLSMAEKNYGKESHSLVPILTNLVNIYRREGNFAEAALVGIRSVELGKTTMGEEHPQVTRAITNLAIVLLMQEDYTQAIEMFRDVLARNQKLEGENRATASALNNLGEALSTAGENTEGLEYLLLAAKMKSSVYGEQHPSTGSTFITLAGVYEKLEEFSKAETEYLKALSIYREVAGTDHPRTIGLHSSLGHLYENLETYKSAHSHLEQAIDSRGSSVGFDQLDDRFAAVRVQWKLGRKKAAKESGIALQELFVKAANVAQDSEASRKLDALRSEFQRWQEQHTKSE